MRRVAKFVSYAVGAVVIVVLVVGGWLLATWSVDYPDTPYPDVVASGDSAVIAQGEYIANAVAHCSACHSPADQLKNFTLNFSSPLEGGYVFEMGPFGTYTAANLSSHPNALGRYEDREVARAIRAAIGTDGKLAPMMRFGVGPMADEDLVAVISYIRTQPPVEAERPRPQYGILAKLLSSRFGPREDPGPSYVPAGEASVERGRYLALGPANCSGCHTPLDPMAGFAPAGPPMSGAFAPEPDATDPNFEIAAPNLTPDPATGHITSWTEDAFVARFLGGRLVRGSPMPWENFQRLTEADVRSVYRYLRTLEPVEHNVGPTRRPVGSFES
jgi:mono/diheme cytochrome c family protein